jgi:hypothetical protein
VIVWARTLEVALKAVAWRVVFTISESILALSSKQDNVLDRSPLDTLRRETVRERQFYTVNICIDVRVILRAYAD